MVKFNQKLQVVPSAIAGLLVIDLPVFGDARGWFKENWQREKMVALGLPDFSPVQNNISFNAERGVTRGLHAEPWDKFISVGSGRVFGVWVDLRAGDGFGRVFTAEIGPDRAIFVPRGVANGYQALEKNTVYTYLVNEHWRADGEYAAVSAWDGSLGIRWPIPFDDAIISKKDLRNPNLRDVEPMKFDGILITGGNGQLGVALGEKYPEAVRTDTRELDITDMESLRKFNFGGISTVINAAAYTNVDGAETEEGRRVAWKVNAVGAANLARICREKGMRLVHISTDYVFDGAGGRHKEVEDFSPLSVYGESKAAGDIAVMGSGAKYYILRTSWVIGEGKNFVRAMMEIGAKGVAPKVVDDQRGRLTFTSELVRGIDYLLGAGAEDGVYNLTNSGEVVSWAEIAEEVFKLGGFRQGVVKITTDEYYAGKEGVARRPLDSGLDLSKIQGMGFVSKSWREDLRKYVRKEMKK